LGQVDFKGVKTLIGIENPILHRGVLDAFRYAGCNDMRQMHAHGDINLIEDEIFDLIILSTQMGEAVFLPIIVDLRNGMLSHHAFPIVIMLIADAEYSHVREVISSGADDVLLMPLSLGTILSRASILAEKRKKFIITDDYTGPDRRTGARPGDPKIPLFDVPNPLRARLAGTTKADFAIEVEQADHGIRLMKIEALAIRFRRVVTALGQLFSTKHSVDSAALHSYAGQLKEMADGLPKLLGDKMMNHRLFGLLSNVLVCIKLIEQHSVDMAAKDLHLISEACNELCSELDKLVTKPTISDGQRG